EANSAFLEDLSKYREELLNLLNDWPLENIFNCDKLVYFGKWNFQDPLLKKKLQEKDKKRVTILLYTNVTAWNNISCDTLLNCWKKTNIISLSQFENSGILLSIISITSDTTITGDIIPFQQYDIQEIQNLISQLSYEEDFINTDYYIEIDDSLQFENIDIANRDIIKKNQLK
ncbi:2238_t:CDS:2, partial [Diversispora eburnea]